MELDKKNSWKEPKIDFLMKKIENSDHDYFVQKAPFLAFQNFALNYSKATPDKSQLFLNQNFEGYQMKASIDGHQKAPTTIFTIFWWKIT